MPRVRPLFPLAVNLFSVWYVAWAAAAVVVGGVGPSTALCVLVAALTVGLNLHHRAHPSWYVMALVWKGGMIYGAVHGWWRAHDLHQWMYDTGAVVLYLVCTGDDLPYFTNATRRRLQAPVGSMGT